MNLSLNYCARTSPFDGMTTIKWHWEGSSKYLMNPPMLMPPVPGRPLILYMTMLDESMGCMLGEYDDFEKRQRVVYYLSKKFNAC